MKYAFTKCAVIDYGDAVTYSGRCVITDKPYSVTVPHSGLVQYRAGVLIQDAFPELSAEDREFLVSGTSPEGWSKIYGP